MSPEFKRATKLLALSAVVGVATKLLAGDQVAPVNADNSPTTTPTPSSDQLKGQTPVQTIVETLGLQIPTITATPPSSPRSTERTRALASSASTTDNCPNPPGKVYPDSKRVCFTLNGTPMMVGALLDGGRSPNPTNIAIDTADIWNMSSGTLVSRFQPSFNLNPDAVNGISIDSLVVNVPANDIDLLLGVYNDSIVDNIRRPRAERVRLSNAIANPIDFSTHSSFSTGLDQTGSTFADLNSLSLNSDSQGSYLQAVIQTSGVTTSYIDRLNSNGDPGTWSKNNLTSTATATRTSLPTPSPSPTTAGRVGLVEMTSNQLTWNSMNASHTYIEQFYHGNYTRTELSPNGLAYQLPTGINDTLLLRLDWLQNTGTVTSPIIGALATESVNHASNFSMQLDTQNTTATYTWISNSAQESIFTLTSAGIQEIPLNSSANSYALTLQNGVNCAATYNKDAGNQGFTIALCVLK